MSHPTNTATDDPNTVVDSEGNATTPLHEAMHDAAVADPSSPNGGTSAEGADDGESDNDSGDDVDESSASDDKDDDDAPKYVANIFQRYASASDARNAAEQFTPKTFRSNGSGEPDNIAPVGGQRLNDVASLHAATNAVVQPDDALHIVGGSSATLDSNGDRKTEQQLLQTMRAGGDTRAFEQQRDAGRANVLGVRAAFPKAVALDPLARVPKPQQ